MVRFIIQNENVPHIADNAVNHFAFCLRCLEWRAVPFKSTPCSGCRVKAVAALEGMKVGYDNASPSKIAPHVRR